MLRKRMGIEPTVPLLAQSTIGFEDRAAHQSQMRFRPRYHTGFMERQGADRTSGFILVTGISEFDGRRSPK